MTSKRSRLAFTLIELLMVVTIILVIAALMIVLANFLMEKVRRTVTVQRMDAINAGLTVYRGEEGATALIGIALDRRVRFASLRSILIDLTEVSQPLLKLDGPPGPNKAARNVNLLPHLGTRWEKRPNPVLWRRTDTNLDNAILFLDRQYSPKIGKIGDIYDEVAYRDSEYQSSSRLMEWMRHFGNNHVAVQLNYRTADVTDTYSNHHTDWLVRPNGNASPVGETLDRTMEIAPEIGNGKKASDYPTSWYYANWPYLREVQGNKPDGTPTYTQTAWPVSDWRTATDLTKAIPPIWNWPWGRPVITRIRGIPAEGFVEPHDLGEFSPLAGVRLLQASSILPAGSDGAASYREDRSAARVWNDRWGSPLIVAFAAQMAPRYDFYRGAEMAQDTFQDLSTGQVIRRHSRVMHGGRDYFALQCSTHYGRARSLYVSTGAVCGRTRMVLPEPWADTDDLKIQRDLWLEVLEITQVGRDLSTGADQERAFTEQSINAPSWQQVLIVTRDTDIGERTSIIKQPIDPAK